MEYVKAVLVLICLGIPGFIVGWSSAKTSVIRAVRKAQAEPHSMKTLERIGFLSGLQRVLELI